MGVAYHSALLEHKRAGNFIFPARGRAQLCRVFCPGSKGRSGNSANVALSPWNVIRLAGARAHCAFATGAVPHHAGKRVSDEPQTSVRVPPPPVGNVGLRSCRAVGVCGYVRTGFTDSYPEPDDSATFRGLARGRIGAACHAHLQLPRALPLLGQ